MSLIPPDALADLRALLAAAREEQIAADPSLPYPVRPVVVVITDSTRN